MAEYIEREAAADYLEQPITMSMCISISECLAKRAQRKADFELVMSIPAADVTPVRHGHWIGTEYDGYADGNPVYTLFECSECGVEYEQEEHYCPWCGARMDGDGNG